MWYTRACIDSVILFEYLFGEGWSVEKSFETYLSEPNRVDAIQRTRFKGNPWFRARRSLYLYRRLREHASSDKISQVVGFWPFIQHCPLIAKRSARRQRVRSVKSRKRTRFRARRKNRSTKIEENRGACRSKIRNRIKATWVRRAPTNRRERKGVKVGTREAQVVSPSPTKIGIYKIPVRLIKQPVQSDRGDQDVRYRLIPPTCSGVTASHQPRKLPGAAATTATPEDWTLGWFYVYMTAVKY